MAPLSWPMAALGMASVAVGSAIPRPRKIMGRDVAEDIAYYCQGWDLADAASISKLWNEGDNAVGTSMASFAQDVVGDDYPNHKWADHMMEVAQPNVGDNGLGGCGIPGGECDPNIECEDFANRGFGELYWPLRALVGMHSKLNIAHEWLQDATIESILSLSEIASDFTGTN
ncbi:hypothetical protein LTR09_007581 [Extremus antarcticus]|uniref:Uncharacterized protein n=1 Tax=Extremus antarcticus TaxID=702011 RepID=A0AAJ0DC17_9PEZI|nr:hypothetical protein LTR09_007581 [Extremus antarcticus]